MKGFEIFIFVLILVEVYYCSELAVRKVPTKIIKNKHISLKDNSDIAPSVNASKVNSLSCETLSIRTDNLELSGWYVSWWTGISTDEACEIKCYQNTFGKPLFAWTRQKSIQRCWCMESLYTTSPGGYSDTDFSSGFYPNAPSLPLAKACQHFQLQNYLLYPIPSPEFINSGVYQIGCAQYVCGNKFWIWEDSHGDCYCSANTNNYEYAAIGYSSGNWFGMNSN